MPNKTPVLHLPGDVTFSDPAAAGLVLAAHCALKDIDGDITNDILTALRGFGQFGKFKTITGEEVEVGLTMESPSWEIQAVLTGGDLIVAGYEPQFGEVVGPAVAGLFPALTQIPLLAKSEIVRKCSDAEGQTITDRLTNAVGPIAGQYSIVPATGVITVEAAYILYAVVNYAKYNAAAGKTLVYNPSAVIDTMDITIHARAWEPELSVPEKGGVTVKLFGCEILKKVAPFIFKSEAANTITPRFGVTSYRISAFTS